MRKFILSFFILISFVGWNFSYAESVDELKSKINNKTKEIEELEREIELLDKNVRATVSEKQTLKTELKQADAIKKKLEADVALTTKKINLADLSISNLEKDIKDKVSRIGSSRETVIDSLQIIREVQSTSIAENLLSGNNLSLMWSQVSSLEDFQSKLVSHIKELRAVRDELDKDKTKLEREKKKSITFKGQLSDQKKIAEQNINLKNKLIKDTSNKEANYRKQLSEIENRRQAVERELSQFESDLRITIDPKSLPTIGSKILFWPLDVVKITQEFGNTAFSRTQPIYNGKGHNGIDFRASVGTLVRAAGSGTVVGTGDTDKVCYGASYGRWIMIDHHNGMATIYGHLSLIKVSQGDRVVVGDMIGYTGKTGYATGPHLHFTVAATQAVHIDTLKSKVKGCGTYTIPLGPFNGYLNPLLYL